MEAQAFTLDTSGEVFIDALRAPAAAMVPAGVDQCGMTWKRLTPFQQGTLAAASAEAWANAEFRADFYARHGKRNLAFSDWSPAALERIMGDCERHAATFEPRRTAEEQSADGRAFWQFRSLGDYAYAGFPALTVSLSPEGSVNLSEGN